MFRDEALLCLHKLTSGSWIYYIWLYIISENLKSNCLRWQWQFSWTCWITGIKCQLRGGILLFLIWYKSWSSSPNHKGWAVNQNLVLKLDIILTFFWGFEPVCHLFLSWNGLFVLGMFIFPALSKYHFFSVLFLKSQLRGLDKKTSTTIKERMNYPHTKAFSLKSWDNVTPGKAGHKWYDEWWLKYLAAPISQSMVCAH